MSKADFQYPPMFDFPPFFTRQITDATWNSQVLQWESVVLSFFKSRHLFKIDLHEATTPGNTFSAIFENKKINRRLSLETLRDIIEAMAIKGTAEWVEKGSRNEAWIYWHTPDEWASLLWNWINETGQNNQIVTFYEIANGELSEGQDFYEIDKTVLNKALNILVKKGHAQIFKGTDEDSMGVKFFS